MYCKKCGKEIMDEALICPNCGCPTDNYKTNAINGEDKATAGMITLSILFPIVGIIFGIVKICNKSVNIGVIYLTIGIISSIFCSIAGYILLNVINNL